MLFFVMYTHLAIFYVWAKIGDEMNIGKQNFNFRIYQGIG